MAHYSQETMGTASSRPPASLSLDHLSGGSSAQSRFAIREESDSAFCGIGNDSKDHLFHSDCPRPSHHEFREAFQTDPASPLSARIRLSQCELVHRDTLRDCSARTLSPLSREADVATGSSAVRVESDFVSVDLLLGLYTGKDISILIVRN